MLYMGTCVCVCVTVVCVRASAILDRCWIGFLDDYPVYREVVPHTRIRGRVARVLLSLHVYIRTIFAS